MLQNGTKNVRLELSGGDCGRKFPGEIWDPGVDVVIQNGLRSMPPQLGLTLAGSKAVTEMLWRNESSHVEPSALVSFASHLTCFKTVEEHVMYTHDRRNHTHPTTVDEDNSVTVILGSVFAVDSHGR